MKIGLVYDAIFPYMIGGAERRFFEIARHLNSRHEVCLIGWQFWTGPPVFSQNGITYIGVGLPSSFYDKNGRRTFKEAFDFAVRIMPTLLNGHYDVIDCSSIPYLPVISSRLSRVPNNIIVTWHEYLGDRWNAYLGKRAHAARAIEWASAHVGVARIAVSEFTKDRLPGDKPRTLVVPNGIQCNQIEASAPASEAFDLLFVGRLLPHKRVDMVLRALKVLPRSLSLGIVGSGPEEAKLQSLVGADGLEGQVKFLGNVDEQALYGLMKASKILVQPSEQEGQSIVVMEGMACGAVPVVSKAPDSAAPELIRHNVDGLAVEDTVEALAAGILELHAQPDKRQSLAVAAKLKAKDFDWSRTAEQMETIYGGLCPQ